MKKNKITATIVIIWAVVVSVLLFSCTPAKNNCGTKKQHKARVNKTKKMAPFMAN